MGDKPHGYMMSAPGSRDDPTPKSLGGLQPRPSDPLFAAAAQPAGGGGAGSGNGSGPHTDAPATIVPVPVALNWSTILKLTGVTVVALVGAASAVIYYVHKTNLHIVDSTIHLTRGERAKLETKAEAQEHRAKLVQQVSKEANMVKRELAVQQKAQIQKLGKTLRKEQQDGFRKLRKEVRALSSTSHP